MKWKFSEGEIRILNVNTTFFFRLWAFVSFACRTELIFCQDTKHLIT